AFFRQIETTPPNERPTQIGAKKKIKGKMGDKEFTLADDKANNSTGLVGFERRNAAYFFTDSSFLDGKKVPKNYEGTRRDKLADYVTTSPFFAKAMVNRMWGHFFGMSFTRGPVDDFH